MATGKKPAKAAGKLLGSKRSSAKVKSVAASDLAQTPKHSKGAAKKAAPTRKKAAANAPQKKAKGTGGGGRTPRAKRA